MNQTFSRRRDRLLTYRAMREGKITSSRRAMCSACGEESPQLEWDRNLQVCPRCGFHAPIGAYYRLSNILDPGSFQELEDKLSPADPLAFPDYRSKLSELELSTGLKDAAVAALGRIDGRRAVFAVLDSRFLMGSMGTAVGEKTAAAVQRFQSGGGLYISCFTHPTTGGVTASFASLGDIMLAEPGALIGFAGPRVIEQTIKEQLPEGFQRAEYLLDHGFLDRIVPRSEWRAVLSQLLALHEKGGRT